jgi:hypothetical protein
MSGPGEGKIKIGKADIYIHLKGKSNARVTHIDIELDELNKIIKPGEASYVQAKEGGVFIGLKKEMIDRAEKLVKSPNPCGFVPRTKVCGLSWIW